MTTLAAIFSALGAIATLALKWLSERGDVKSLTAQLEASHAELAKEHGAGEERRKYAKELETSLAEHLKTCRTPLASWANGLRKNRGGGEAGPVPDGS